MSDSVLGVIEYDKAKCFMMAGRLRSSAMTFTYSDISIQIHKNTLYFLVCQHSIIYTWCKHSLQIQMVYVITAQCVAVTLVCRVFAGWGCGVFCFNLLYKPKSRK